MPIIHLPVTIALSGLLILSPVNNTALVPASSNQLTPTNVLSSHNMSLHDRYPNQSVNEVFKENILLNLAYLDGEVKDKYEIDWQKIVQGNHHFKFTLKPGQTFVYHEAVLPGYENTLVGASHYSADEGYKSDGYLYGDGVCHLASLFNWVASDAGLSVNAPTKHDFAPIPDIPKQYGTAIYFSPGADSVNTQENLYITNSKNQDISFYVSYDQDQVKVSVVE